MNRLGSLLTGLMLLAAQVPWVACPCPDEGGLTPAVTQQSAHAHHGACSGHHHAPAPKDDEERRGPSFEAPSHVHDVITATLVADATRAELPAFQADPAGPHAVARSAEGEQPASVRPEGLEPPPPRPPSAPGIEDHVRLLS